jgi:hypothetical protein
MKITPTSIMIRATVASLLLSVASGQLSPAGSCPQKCLVQAGPQISTTPFQSPLTYKNMSYHAQLTPSTSLQLFDSRDVQTNYMYNGWIVSNSSYIGQSFIGSSSSSATSSYSNIIVRYVCDSTQKPLEYIEEPCTDAIVYSSPEFCRIRFNSDTSCSTQIEYPSLSATPIPGSDGSLPSQSPTMTAHASQNAIDTTKPTETSTMIGASSGSSGDSSDGNTFASSSPTMTTRPSQKSTETPTMSSRPIVSDAPTEKPTERSTVSAMPTEKPTERSTVSAMPTERSTVSAMPTEEPKQTERSTPEPTKDVVITDDTFTPMPTSENPDMPSNEETARPTLSAPPTQRPTLSAPPTQRPTLSAPPTPRLTPRPTLSALPTRRPTLSALPTRVFRSPPPVELAKFLRSQIRIETRNESLFENPKNVEAVVKTIVCALKVPAETVSVTGIQHFVDNILVGTIPVPVRNSSRNITDECMGTGPTPQPSPAEPIAFRRLQSGLDTYVVQYQVQDPPVTVVAMEPATIATLIQTAPTLITSLDIPTGSYVAITAEPPTYAAAAVAAANDPIINTNPANDSTNSILIGVFIPLAIATIGSILALTYRKRAHHPARQAILPVVSTKNVLIEANPEFTQINPNTKESKIVRVVSKYSIMPQQVRKV